jgi:CheY-like chemotaxis protein
MENKSSVLLIDDEESVCAGVRDLLGREAFDIEYRLSAEQGIEYLEGHKVDLVLLDINLGSGKMDGITALKGTTFIVELPRKLD